MGIFWNGSTVELLEKGKGLGPLPISDPETLQALSGESSAMTEGSKGSKEMSITPW